VAPDASFLLDKNVRPAKVRPTDPEHHRCHK
jgi:hypothetical protein